MKSHVRIFFLVIISYELLLCQIFAYTYDRNENQNENYHYPAGFTDYYNLGKKLTSSSSSSISSLPQSLGPLLPGTSTVTTGDNSQYYFNDNSNSGGNSNARKRFSAINYGNYNDFIDENSKVLNNHDNNNNGNNNEYHENQPQLQSNQYYNNFGNGGFIPITTTKLPKLRKEIISPNDFITNMNKQNYKNSEFEEIINPESNLQLEDFENAHQYSQPILNQNNNIYTKYPKLNQMSSTFHQYSPNNLPDSYLKHDLTSPQHNPFNSNLPMSYFPKNQSYLDNSNPYTLENQENDKIQLNSNIQCSKQFQNNKNLPTSYRINRSHQNNIDMQKLRSLHNQYQISSACNNENNSDNLLKLNSMITKREGIQNLYHHNHHHHPNHQPQQHEQQQQSSAPEQNIMHDSISSYIADNYQQNLNDNNYMGTMPSQTNYYQPKEISITSSSSSEAGLTSSIPNSESIYGTYSNEMIQQQQQQNNHEEQSSHDNKMNYFQPFSTITNPIIHHSSQLPSLSSSSSFDDKNIKTEELTNEVSSTSDIANIGLDKSPSLSFSINDLYPLLHQNHHQHQQNEQQHHISLHTPQYNILPSSLSSSSSAAAAAAAAQAAVAAYYQRPILAKHVDIKKTKHIPVPIYKKIHVPVKVPVDIKIPQPVIMTIPKPLPIQIPVTKTVKVPMQKELKIPVEKLIPMLIEKRIPYKVEKHVAYPVEKHIPIPIYKPFPVRVPIIKTILHKAKVQHHHHHPIGSSLSSSIANLHQHQYQSNYDGWNYK